MTTGTRREFLKKIGPATLSKRTTVKWGDVFYVGWSNQEWDFDTFDEAVEFATRNKRTFEVFEQAAALAIRNAA